MEIVRRLLSSRTSRTAGRLVATAAVLVGLGGLLMAIAPARAADGDLDPTFNRTGIVVADAFPGSNFLVHAAVLQPDGKVVVAGYVQRKKLWRFGLARFTANGSLDRSFGGTGAVATAFGSHNDRANAVVLQPDGKIVAAGFMNGAGFALARYNATGSLDPTFGRSGRVVTVVGAHRNAVARGLVLQPDGKLVAAGVSSLGPTVVRYNPDGSLDRSFAAGSGISSSPSGADLEGLALGSDGSLVVAGTAFAGPSASGPMSFWVTRFRADGSLDPSFGHAGSATANPGGSASQGWSLALGTDGRILVGGSGTRPDNSSGFAMVRYRPDGSLDPTFGGGTGAVMSPVAGCGGNIGQPLLEPDGRIVVGGLNAASSGQPCLERYNTDGSPDTSFGAGTGLVITNFGGGSAGLGLLRQPDGKVIEFGTIPFHGGFRAALARHQFPK